MNGLTLDKLKKKEVITAEHVTTLKKYIKEKFKDRSDAHHANVFADAVRKTVDRQLEQFEQQEKDLLRSKIISDAVIKPSFTIDSLDFFNAFVFARRKNTSGTFMWKVCDWVEQSIGERHEPEELEVFMALADRTDLDELPVAIDIPEVAENLSEAAAAVETTSDESQFIEAVFVKAQEPEGLIFDKTNAVFSLERIKHIAVAAVFAVIFICSLAGLKVEANLEHAIGNAAANEWVDRYPSLEVKVMDKLQSRGYAVAKIPLAEGLNENLRYKEISRKALKGYLDKRNSLIAEEPYLSAIYAVAKQYDVNPLLLVAVTGQEQGYVPKSSPFAKRIINNPFNVYGSWEKYNTDIMDSACLAAETLVNASKQRPLYVNTIKWINRRYAEDENWWKGVYALFLELEAEMMDKDGKL